jgi:hypothetical protein
MIGWLVPMNKQSYQRKVNFGQDIVETVSLYKITQ